MNRAKIIATLGPSSLSKEIVAQMDHLGVDLFRINLSHTNINDLEDIITMVQRWTSKKICIDTEGAQLRVGRINNNSMRFNSGEQIRFCGSEGVHDGSLIPLNVPNPHEILRVGDLLKIDFNSVLVQITEIDELQPVARVLKKGAVGNNKGIGIDRAISLPAFTDKDMSAFEITKQLGLDTVFLSFCSSGGDVLALRKIYNYPISIISKVESRLSIFNLDSICAESDAVLIDRGDLSRDVPLTKIPFAQSHILDTAKQLDVPVYVATNLLETMVEKTEPTRAEIHDVVRTLQDGAAGLVLAAEAAIGLNPPNCVRVLSSLINEVENKPGQFEEGFLFENPSGIIIAPHGGHLVNQYLNEDTKLNVSDLITLDSSEKMKSDVVQIANGVYSPLDRFMNLEELSSVLEKNQLLDGTVWTMPIILQAKKIDKSKIIGQEYIALRSAHDNEAYAVIKSPKVEEISDMNVVSQGWFGTADKRHPGVKEFFAEGNYIVSGTVLLIEKPAPVSARCYDLTPRQTRSIFSDNGWSNIVGFHTRNVPHRAHEYIQLKALNESKSDAIFISPVTGLKKSGDFLAMPVIECYNALIRSNYYGAYGAVIGAFNTYSRYCGPREAAFTAICRKNFGCNHFIVGRDHAGVGDFYASDASVKIFDSLDLGVNILNSEPVSCVDGELVSGEAADISDGKTVKPISGSAVRDCLVRGEEIPEYLMRKNISKILHDMIEYDADSMFQA